MTPRWKRMLAVWVSLRKFMERNYESMPKLTCVQSHQGKGQPQDCY